jgi:hypothetical protein
MLVDFSYTVRFVCAVDGCDIGLPGACVCSEQIGWQRHLWKKVEPGSVI